jgi:hypothetical protein
VVSLGGIPATILPSPVGAVPGWPGEGSCGNPGNGGEKEEWKDKIEAIIFDDWVNLGGFSSGGRKGVNIKFGVLRRRPKT